MRGAVPISWRRLDGFPVFGMSQFARLACDKGAPPLIFLRCPCDARTCARHSDAGTLAGWGFSWPAPACECQTITARCPSCHEEA